MTPRRRPPTVGRRKPAQVRDAVMPSREQPRTGWPFVGEPPTGRTLSPVARASPGRLDGRPDAAHGRHRGHPATPGERSSRGRPRRAVLSVTRRLLGQYVRRPSSAVASAQPSAGHTARETEVRRLIAAGLSNAEIAFTGHHRDDREESLAWPRPTVLQLAPHVTHHEADERMSPHPLLQQLFAFDEGSARASLTLGNTPAASSRLTVARLRASWTQTSSTRRSSTGGVPVLVEPGGSGVVSGS